MKILDSVEEFFEAKYIKNYQRVRAVLIWMAATAALSGSVIGFLTGRLLLQTILPIEIRIFITLATSLIFGLFLTYHYKYVRFVILSVTGFLIISPVLYLVFKSGIF